MSTIIEVSGTSRPLDWWFGAVGVLFGWFAMVVVVTAVLEPTDGVVVIGPSASTLTALSGSDTRIVDAGGGYLLVRGRERGFVRALYAGGAWLVLPMRSGGCIGEQAQPR